jgi:glycosyltransferase involved in cell wall biosynthesis
MKVLHVITGLATGGAERTLHNLLAGGVAAKFESHVVSLTEEGAYGSLIRALGVPVHALGMRRGMPPFGAVRELRHLVRVVRPQVVQGWMYHGNLATVVAAGVVAKRSAVAFNVRQSLYNLANEKRLTRLVIRANRLLSRRVDKVIYNSRVAREQHEAFGFARQVGCVIPNGFDLQHLRPDVERRKTLRLDMEIPTDARVAGHVARFHPMKNHLGFLNAAIRLARSRSDVWFVLIGRGVEEGNRRLSGIIPSGLRHRFKFLGERHDVEDLMQTMDVLCLSSSWGEGFPNVLGEAMAIGIPCITTDVGDSAEIVNDTGMVVPPNDDKALTKEMEAILTMSVAEREALGQRARRRIERHYSIESAVSQYSALYEGLAERSN